MAWFQQTREQLRRMPDGKLAPAAKVKEQAAKLKEAEDFKPADVATSKGELVALDPKTGQPIEPVKQASTPVPQPLPPASAPASYTKPMAVPQAAPAQAKPAAAAKPKKKSAWRSFLDWGHSAEEDLEEDLAADAEKKPGEQAKPAPKKLHDQEPKPKQETAVAEDFKPAPIAMSTAPPPAVKPVSNSSTQTGMVPGLFNAFKKKDKLEEDLEEENEKEAEKAGWANSVKKAQETEQAKQVEKAKEAEKVKLAEAEKFQPAPIAMSTNLPAPASKPASSASPQTGMVPGLFNAFKKKDKTEDELKKELEEEAKKAGWANSVKKAQEAEKAKQVEKTKEAEKTKLAEADKFKPAPIAMSMAPAPAAKPTAAPAKQTGLVPGLFNAFKKEKKPEDELEEDLKEDEKKSAWANKVAEDRKVAEAKKAEEKKKAEEAKKPVDATKLPQHEKPTLDQYLANPSRYGPTVKPRSTYKPTAADVAKQPFQAPKPVCNALGRYLAAENCKTCRSMDNFVHCPCNCGSHIPIDRNYNPFGGEASPDFKVGKSSTRLW